MTTSGARVVVVLLALLGVTRSAQAQTTRGPPVPPTASPRACTLASTNLSGTVTLQSDCVYTGQTLVIEQSNTTLDCNGARLTGASTSIVVRGQIDHVTVKNCYIADAGGVTVTSPKRLPGETDDQLRARSPTHVVITHMSIENAKSVGVFFGPCVVGPVIEDSIIEGSGSTGGRRPAPAPPAASSPGAGRSSTWGRCRPGRSPGPPVAAPSGAPASTARSPAPMPT